MATTLPKTDTRRINTQQLAWGIMLASFAIFCVIAGAAILGVRFFLFQSRVPLASSVEVARGTPTLTRLGAELQQTAVTRSNEITGGSVVTTNNESQALLRFADPQRTDEQVASITVGTGSSLHLRQSSRPRFDWSEDAYWLEFDGAYGTIDIFVPQNLGRSILITMDTTLGPSVRFSASGRYTITAARGYVQVLNFEGDALLIAQDGRTQPVGAGQTSSIAEGSNQFAVLPLTNLFGDIFFTTENVIDFNSTSEQVFPQAWRCDNLVENPDQPIGSYSLVTNDMRPALRFFRGDNALSNGATRCYQGLGTGTGGLDVSNYRSVSIRVTFKIQSQSLSACGSQGSECPLMLRMDYLPADGGDARSWYHGFYASVDPNRQFPYACSGCDQHERVSLGEWYTYESHNLFEVFAPATQPKSILNLRFYASGHQYEVYVSEVALIADNTPIIELPVAEATQEG